MSSGNVVVSNLLLPFVKTIGHRILLVAYILVKILIVILLLLAQCLFYVLQILLIPIYVLLILITAPLRIVVLITKLAMTFFLFVLLCPRFAWDLLMRLPRRNDPRRRSERRARRLEYY